LKSFSFSFYPVWERLNIHIALPLAGFWVAAQKKSGLPKKSALL